MNTSTLNGTLAMIDNLKTVCANFGLANDSSEYKIITEAFLYKYLNDRMIYELGGLEEFTDCHDVQSIEEQYRNLDAERREMLPYELGTTAIIRPEWMVSSLYNQKDKDDFATTFDAALIGIAQDNLDVYSVKAGAESITLFQGVSRFIVEENKRNGFCSALIGALVDFSFADSFSQGYDFFSQVFEYLIKDYNKDSGSYGEYFTPHAIANIMARILAPQGDSNVTIYDPAAGSGTLVLALAHQVGEGNCTVYTQDRSQKANEFMRLNLILNGQVNSLANVVHDDTLVSPRHLSYDGKSLKTFDYIVSNPPFKADFSASRDVGLGKVRQAFLGRRAEGAGEAAREDGHLSGVPPAHHRFDEAGRQSGDRGADWVPYREEQNRIEDSPKHGGFRYAARRDFHAEQYLREHRHKRVHHLPRPLQAV